MAANPFPPATSRARVVTRVFVMASVAHFLHGLGVHAYLHLPGYLERLGAAEVEIGAMASTLSLCAIAARPFFGRAMDVRGRRSMIRLSGLLHVVVCALYLTVTDVGIWVYVVRGLHGIASAMMFSSLFTYAADIVPESRRTEGLALFGVSGLLPIALGSLIGDAVLQWVDYRELFWVTVVFASLGFAFSLPLREQADPKSAPPGRGFFAAALQRDLLPLWFVGSVFAAALSAVFIFLKTFVLEVGFGSVGLFMAAYSVAAALLRVAFGWLPERVGPKRVLAPAIFVLAAGLVVLAHASGPEHVVLAGVLTGLGHGFAFPIVGGLVVERAGPGDRGSALSLFTAIFDAGFLVGGPLFGVVIEASGYSRMFLVAAGLAVAGTLVFTVWDAQAARPTSR